MNKLLSKLPEKFKEEIKRFFNKVRSDSLDANSAQISFFIVISFIPFVMLILSILQTVNINGISLLNSVLNLLPSAIKSFVIDLFPEDLEVFATVSIAAVACIWSSSMAMRALIKGINRIFESTYRRGYIWLRLISILYTVIFAVVLVISAVLLIFGNTIYEEIDKFIPWHFMPTIIDFKSLWVFLILSIFFTFTYYFIPFKVKHKLRNCFFGAVIAAGGWILFSFFFSLYVENSARYSAVYGSLATLVIFMFWLYFCMYIMFLGGEIAVWLEGRPSKNKK